MKEHFFKNLRALRAKLGISQCEMADKINVSQSTYQRIENGSSQVAIHYINKLCDALNITEKELLEKDGLTFTSNGEPTTNEGYLLELIESKNKYISLLESIIEEKNKLINMYEKNKC